MRFPLNFYEQLRNNIRTSDIVRQKVSLTKKGNEYSGLCPFHGEKTPSFTVNDAKRFYHCFGCGAHGDIIKFVAENYGMSYSESAKKIAQDNGIELPKISPQQAKIYEESDEIYKILELAAEFFTSQMTSELTNYLLKRGINNSSIKSFGLGFAPSRGKLEEFFKTKSIPLKDLLKSGLFGKRDDGKIYEIFNNRIMFPIKNIYNKIVGFGGRALGDAMPKYINSPETIVFKKSETMYGENIATTHAYKDNYYIIVEGYTDVIALHQAGFKHAVASLGTSVTEKHIAKLWRSSDEIVACLDGDSAGKRASSRLINMALPSITAMKSTSFIRMPTGADPDDFIKNNGSESFAKLLSHRISLSEMIWQQEFTGKAFNTAEARARLESTLFEYSAKIEDNALKANFKSYFKEKIWNDLIRKNSKSKKIVATISQEVADTKKYSEMEMAEHAICAYLIKFPEIIEQIDADFILKNQALSEFKDWIIDLHLNKTDLKFEDIENSVKNTRFFDIFLVLLKHNNIFLNVNFLGKQNVDHLQIFEWLLKKHYLLLLKQEYTDTLNEKEPDSTKLSSYISEIQKISKEIARLGETFVD